MCPMSIKKLSTFPTSDIQYLMESDGPTTSYRPHITPQLPNKYSIDIRSGFAEGNKVKMIQYFYISLSSHLILTEWSYRISRIPTELLFGGSIG